MQAFDPTRLCWPFEQWPAADQAAWMLGCTPGDAFEPPYGTTLRPDSLTKIRKGYGRWLSFLYSRGWLDPVQPPLARATKVPLRAYIQHLRQSGNADYTIIGRVSELERAMKIMAPGEDVSWIRRPDGVTVYAALAKTKADVMVIDSAVGFAWALELMDQAAGQARKLERLLAYRDGLLLAVSFARARRLRSISLLRVGKELLREGGHYRVELRPEQVKTNKRDRFNLPEVLTPYIDHYLTVIRPALLAGRGHDAVWITRGGEKLAPKGIQRMVAVRTCKRFGRPVSIHRCRHGVATTVALHDPGHIGVAAGLLGITEDVLEQHYNRAGAVKAANAYAELIERHRRASAGAGTGRRVS